MRRRTVIFFIFLIGLVVGAGGVIATLQVNHATSTSTFCSSCHSMEWIAKDGHYLASAHVSNPRGIKVGCADCHIPSGNIFEETYTHISQGLKDILAEQTNDFSDRDIWESRRVELAHVVREEMRSQDSVTCRSCHDPAKIQPRSTAGQAAHRLLATQNVTCIDCHFNLVHDPVPASLDFIRGSGLGVANGKTD